MSCGLNFREDAGAINVSPTAFRLHKLYQAILNDAKPPVRSEQILDKVRSDKPPRNTRSSAEHWTTGVEMRTSVIEFLVSKHGSIDTHLTVVSSNRVERLIA